MPSSAAAVSDTHAAAINSRIFFMGKRKLYLLLYIRFYPMRFAFPLTVSTSSRRISVRWNDFSA